MKKRIFAFAVMLICLSVLASTTLAYFTDVGTARNVITSGGVSIQLVEQQLVGDRLVDYPNQPIAAMPGKVVSKIVTVKGLEQAAWIRMNYTVTVLDAAGDAMEIPAAELEKLIVIAADAENWTYRDGWWYCNQPVSAGESTKPLFDKVTFSLDMGNAYQESTVYIDITAQAVQKANNGETVLDAAGWPEG